MATRGFRLDVAEIIREWSVVKMARAQSWAGHETEDILLQMESDLMDNLNERAKNPHEAAQKLEVEVLDFLEVVLEEDFGCVVEDGSLEIVAEQVAQCFARRMPQAAETSRRALAGEALIRPGERGSKKTVVKRAQKPLLPVRDRSSGISYAAIATIVSDKSGGAATSGARTGGAGPEVTSALAAPAASLTALEYRAAAARAAVDERAWGDVAGQFADADDDDEIDASVPPPAYAAEQRRAAATTHFDDLGDLYLDVDMNSLMTRGSSNLTNRCLTAAAVASAAKVRQRRQHARFEAALKKKALKAAAVATEPAATDSAKAASSRAAAGAAATSDGTSDAAAGGFPHKTRGQIKLAMIGAKSGGAKSGSGRGGGGGGGGGGGAKMRRGKDKGRQRHTGRDDRATSEQVMDPRTRLLLFKMMDQRLLSRIDGCVSAGKEANVYYAEGGADAGAALLSQLQRFRARGEAPVECPAAFSNAHGPVELAIKVYKTSILVFKDRDRYLSGEFRFRQGYCRSNPRKMVKLWAEKELRNLRRLHSAGLRCPLPLVLRQHVLVMEFLGKDGWPSPRLKDAELSAAQLRRCYCECVGMMRQMHHICGLVHGDLSEYNLLWHRDSAVVEAAADAAADAAAATAAAAAVAAGSLEAEATKKKKKKKKKNKSHLYVIDVSQSVQHEHPRAMEFLRSDCQNMTDFFRRRGMEETVELLSTQQLFEFIIDESHGEAQALGSNEPHAALPTDPIAVHAQIVGILDGAAVARSLQQSAIDDQVALELGDVHSAAAQESAVARATEIHAIADAKAEVDAAVFMQTFIPRSLGEMSLKRQLDLAEGHESVDGMYLKALHLVGDDAEAAAAAEEGARADGAAANASHAALDDDAGTEEKAAPKFRVKGASSEERRLNKKKVKAAARLEREKKSELRRQMKQGGKKASKGAGKGKGKGKGKKQASKRNDK